MKKNLLDKNFVMSSEDEEKFQSSNKCYAHWSCNINLKLNEKGPVIFHNLRGYDSNSTIKEIGKFDVKASYLMD